MQIAGVSFSEEEEEFSPIAHNSTNLLTKYKIRKIESIAMKAKLND